MFKRIKPLVIHGRTITQPGAAQLAEYMTEERALFVAHLRVEREYTWRMIAEDCGKAAAQGNPKPTFRQLLNLCRSMGDSVPRTKATASE